MITLIPSIHYPLLIQGRVKEASGLEGYSRPPFPHQPLLRSFQARWIFNVPPASSGSAPGSPPSYSCLADLPRGAPRRHPNNTPEQLQLALSNMNGSTLNPYLWSCAKPPYNNNTHYYVLLLRNNPLIACSWNDWAWVLSLPPHLRLNWSTGRSLHGLQYMDADRYVSNMISSWKIIEICVRWT